MKNNTRYIIFLLFPFICTLQLSAEKLNFKNITINNGLTANTINCIFKDSRNFIWLGTSNGLNRFDGVNISSYNEFDNKMIVSICEVDSIHLYIAAEKEIFRYNRKENKAEKLKIDYPQSVKIKKVVSGSPDNLFVIAEEGLFYLKRDKEMKKVPSDNEEILNGINDIIILNQTCWLATNKGLVAYQPDSHHTKLYSFNEKESEPETFSSLCGFDTLIYLSYRNAILEFNIHETSFNKITELDNNLLLNMTYNNGLLYIGTNGGGLKIVNISQRQVTSLTHDPGNPQSISSNAIYSFLLDEDIYWIGTFIGGLNYTPRKKTLFHVYKEGDKFNTKDLNIRSFRIGKEETVIGTRSGVIYLSEKGVIQFNMKNTPQLKSDIIICIYPFEDNFLIGTYGGGLYILNPKTETLTPFGDGPLYRDNSFYAITDDQKGNLWFGTLKGLIKYNQEDQSYTFYNKTNSALISNDIYTIICDSRNRIWVGTNEGVCYYEQDTIHTLTPLEITLNNTVRYIYEDKNQRIWIGTERSGLIKADADLSNVQQITSDHFLTDNFVLSIIEDKLGNLWLCTSKGIISYNPDTEDYQIFSLNDGIPWYIFNSAVQRTQDGKIWWGNEKGLVYTDPQTAMNHLKTNIEITKIYINGKTEEIGSKRLPYSPEYIKTYHLKNSQNSFGVSFSDFSYGEPKSEIYEYKLEGYNSDWQTLIGENEIYFSDIKGGNYLLKIRKAGSKDPIKMIAIRKSGNYSYLWLIIISLLIAATGVLIYKKKMLPLLKAQAQTTKPSPERKKYQNVRLDEQELINIKAALIKYMEKEEPYLNPSLKLEDIANGIQYPKAKISQVLNQHLYTNFADFANRYRIERFKQKAKEGLIQQYTLSALSRDCGFSSRSSFFQSFKKLTGQTPLKFLKDSGIVVDKEEMKE